MRIRWRTICLVTNVRGVGRPPKRWIDSLTKNLKCRSVVVEETEKNVYDSSALRDFVWIVFGKLLSGMNLDLDELPRHSARPCYASNTKFCLIMDCGPKEHKWVLILFIPCNMIKR